jgi:hypothetical protein
MIALEIAAILETKGYRNIFIFLLDSSIRTDRNNKETENEKTNFLVELEKDILEKHGKLYLEKVISAQQPNRELAKSSISAYLKHSKIILFKASESGDEDPDSFSEANNIDLFADKVEIVSLQCAHYDILEKCANQITKEIINRDFNVKC